MNKNHLFTLRNSSSHLRPVSQMQITKFTEPIHKSKEVGKDLIDFDELIWPNDVESIVNTLKVHEVKEFTISCRSTNLIDCLVIFEKFNCRINGLTEVKTGWKRIDGSQKTITALKMEITNE